MATGLLALFSNGVAPVSIREYMDHSSFDELIFVDLNDDTYKFIFNVDEKYLVHTTEGIYSHFYDYASKVLVHPDDAEEYARLMNPAETVARLEAAEIPGVLDLRFRIRNTDGGWRWVEQFVIGGRAHDMADGTFYTYIFDIQNMKDREAGKTRVAYNKTIHADPLTGLIREKDFYAACELNLSDTRINWLLVVIDLQHFKLFNEWYGRESGDRVLADIGRTLDQAADAYDGVAGYMGGDDFSLLVPSERFDIDDLYDRIHAIVKNHGVSVGFLPAIGACRSFGSTSVYDLYDQASLACQEAKRDFKTRVMFFNPSMVKQTVEDYRILSEFKDALESGEISFQLQPQCRALNGKIVGAEALARWVKADGRRVPPVSFIPTLEHYGFIPDLDRFIWEAVCRWCRESLDRGNPLIPVSVNISPVDIFTMDVPGVFLGLIEKYGLPKEAIKVEITESAYSESTEKVSATVQKFRENGFVVLMDDFGSGFSSLNMLRELNVDILKLDAYFLRMDKATEKKGMHILESVVNMAKTMGMPIIVEGVESEKQAEYLMGLGCRYIQGFHYYKPLPPADFEALIADSENVDTRGIQFKANEEFHIREFLNDSVYSDSMLNNIIGPAAVYAWHDGDVDIIRFNQQFYRSVNVPDFNERLTRIQRWMPESDVPVLLSLLEKAYEDRLNGASGTLTFGKVDGSSVRFLIHFYFLNEDGASKRFYGAARDVTQIANLQRHVDLLSRFTSKSVVFMIYQDAEYRFEVVAHGMEGRMGLTREQLEREINTAQFHKRFVPKREEALWNLARACVAQRRTLRAPFAMIGAQGEKLGLMIEANYVDDPTSDVKCILSIQESHG